MNHMLKNTRFHHLKGKTDFAAASTNLFGKPVDMQGFEGCVFIAYGSSKIGRAATTKQYLKVAAAVTTSGPWYNLAGTSSTAAWTTPNFNGKMLITDVYKPLSTQRMLRPLVGGASTDSLYGIFAIQYGLRKPGSSNVWKSSTRAGSTLWSSTRLAQKLAISATHTTVTNT